MIATVVTLIILTFLAFEMEFIFTFFVYLIKADNVYATDNPERYCIQKFYHNETECFSNEFPWTTFPTKFSPVVRFRSMPVHPRRIKPQLLVYDTRSDDWEHFESKKVDFDKNKSSIVITHGWAPEKSGKHERLHLLYAKEFYNVFSRNATDEVNMLAIDWKKGASSLNYPECYNNIRVVARFMLRKLREIDLDLEQTHLVGHSLGAHMMGYLAKEFTIETGRKVRRITGLDPAGPGFNYPRSWYNEFDNLTETHLWHTDADFVDVIHTDAGRFGTGDYGLSAHLGHADFYPNGGNNQPYCQFQNFYRELRRLRSLAIDDIIRSAAGMQSTCDHRMAKVYFIHSFLHPDRYESCPDKKFNTSQAGATVSGSYCKIMGFYATKPDSRHVYSIPRDILPTKIDKITEVP